MTCLDHSPAPHNDALQSLSHRVLFWLDHYRCARELRERLPGTSRKGVETAVRRLARRGLVTCVTTEVKQARLYGRTTLGEMLINDLAPNRGVSPVRLQPHELPVYAWIQAGVYRREVLRAMHALATPKQLRRTVVVRHAEIGINHVYGVLRQFAAKGVATRNHERSWKLTPLGARLRQIDLHGLPWRGYATVPLWAPLDLTGRAAC